MSDEFKGREEAQRMDDLETAMERILAFVQGNAPRPSFEDLAPDARAEAERVLAATEAVEGIDLDMIPAFDEDPVAVRLGFRNGPALVRVSGNAIAAARTALGLSPAQLATEMSRSGHTVDSRLITDLESQPWSTITEAEAAALAAGLGLDAESLGRRPATPFSAATEIARRLVEQSADVVVRPASDIFGNQFPERLVMAYFDLRVLIIVCIDDDERSAAVEFACRTILDMAGLAGIAAVRATAEFPTTLIEPMHATESYGAPSGTHREPQVPTELPLDVAFAGLVERMTLQWARSELDVTRIALGGAETLIMEEANRALSALQATSKRVHVPKRPAFLTVGNAERNDVAVLTTSILARSFLPAHVPRAIEDISGRES